MLNLNKQAKLGHFIISGKIVQTWSIDQDQNTTGLSHYLAVEIYFYYSICSIISKAAIAYFMVYSLHVIMHYSSSKLIIFDHLYTMVYSV
jgi:hypothetical protein